jgi:hypothetical protein
VARRRSRHPWAGPRFGAETRRQEEREEEEAVTPGRSLRVFVPLVYLGCAALFVDVYTAMTRWISPGMAAFTHGQAPFPFRYRVLVTGLASLLERAGVPLHLAYFLLATLAVFGLLLAFDRFLALFVRRDFARVLALGILYPLSWNSLGLNRMYFPFDLPGVALFTLALVLLAERRWGLFYAVFALATLNRETTWLLTFILLAVEWGRLPVRTLVAHVVTQALIWTLIKFTLAHAFPGGPQFANMVSKNVETWTGMLTFSRAGLRDLLKLLLMFGGLWLLVPVLYREQPRFIRRALWTFPIFILPMLVVGTIDEARLYAEWVPLVAAACLLPLAARLGESVRLA